MKHAAIIGAALALAGCALPPMSPEQAAHMRQMQLEQQRAYNAQMLEAQKAITNRQPAQQQSVQPFTSAVQAFWTGQMRQAQSVTGVVGFNCEYNYAGRTFWRMFAGSCPSAVAVQ